MAYDGKQTTGEFRIGIEFDTTNLDLVDVIEMHAAQLINLIESIPDYPDQEYEHGADRMLVRTERMLLRARAMRIAEDAAVLAVKAATKK